MDVGVAVLVGLLFVGGCAIGGLIVHAILSRHD
jgi:hypothetical protein